MDEPRDSSDYGRKTVVDPAWPNVSADAFGNKASEYEKLASDIRGLIVSEKTSSMMGLSDGWEGPAGEKAVGKASAIVSAFETLADSLESLAKKFRRIEAKIAATKHSVNQTAEIINTTCKIFEKLEQDMLAAAISCAASGDMDKAIGFYNSAISFANTIRTMVASGLAENTGLVASRTVELGQELGVPAGTPGADGKVPPPTPPPAENPSVPASLPTPGLPGGGGGQGSEAVAGGTQNSVLPVVDTGTGNGQGTEAVAGGTQNSVLPPVDAGTGNGQGNVAAADRTQQPQLVVQQTGTSTSADPGAVPAGAPGGGGMAGGGGTSATGGGGASTGAAAAQGTPGAPAGTPGAPGAGQPTGAGAGQPGGPKAPELPKMPQTQQPMTPAANAGGGQPVAATQPATPTAQPSPQLAPTGASSGGASSGMAPMSTSGAPSMSASAPAGAAPVAAAPAPLGPPPTPAPAAPVAQPGVGGPAGPGVAPMASQQQQAAAAAPIPVTAARAEKDALAEAARAGLVRKPSKDGDLQLAERIAAALHAPPCTPLGSWSFTWSVGVLKTGQIIASNSYGVCWIPDGVQLHERVLMVSSDERIPPEERGRWVRDPYALQAWAAFHGETLRAVIGTAEEVKPFEGSFLTKIIEPEDIPASGVMQGRSRLEVIAPAAAARLAAWPAAELIQILPPQPVQLVPPPDQAQISQAWLDALTPLAMTTGEAYRSVHLSALAAYSDLRMAQALFHAYSAQYTDALRAAIAEFLYFQNFSVLQRDSTRVGA